MFFFAFFSGKNFLSKFGSSWRKSGKVFKVTGTAMNRSPFVILFSGGMAEQLGDIVLRKAICSGNVCDYFTVTRLCMLSHHTSECVAPLLFSLLKEKIQLITASLLELRKEYRALEPLVQNYQDAVNQLLSSSLFVAADLLHQQNVNAKILLIDVRSVNDQMQDSFMHYQMLGKAYDVVKKIVGTHDDKVGM